MYQFAIRAFMRFTGIREAEEFRIITRAHVIAWRKSLVDQGLSGATIRARLAALSSLYEYLCDHHAVPFNPVKGVRRPKVETTEARARTGPRSWTVTTTSVGVSTSESAIGGE